MISATKGNVAVRQRQRQRQPALRTRKRVFESGEHCYFLVTAQPAPLQKLNLSLYSISVRFKLA